MSPGELSPFNCRAIKCHIIDRPPQDDQMHGFSIDDRTSIVIKLRFFTFIFAIYTIFYAICISDTCPTSRKSISIPNFSKISQSMAEIKLLSVYENGQPP